MMLRTQRKTWAKARGKVRFPILTMLVGLIIVTGTGHAREVLREGFDNVVGPAGAGLTAGKTAGQKGWTQNDSRLVIESAPVVLERAVAFDNVRRGAISFDIMRKPGHEADSLWRTVFTLVGGDGQDAPFFLQIQWNSPVGPNRPIIGLRGHEFGLNGMGLWSGQTLLDRDILPGQWIHVDLTWDDDAGKYQLWVDGRRQDSQPRLYGNDGKVQPDYREEENRERARQGLTPLYSSRPFGELIKKVTAVHLGIHTIPALPGKGFSPLSHAVVSNFVVLAGEWPPDTMPPARIASVSDDTFKVTGISGKLVAGDKVTATMVAAPGGKASFDMGNVRGVPMEPVPASPGGPGVPAVDNGTYRGMYTIKPGDDYENGQIVGNFVSSDNVAATPVISASKWTIETKPRVNFSIDKTDMPADSTTKARIKLVAKDANGNAVQGRHMKLTLATTDEYTGLVGAGDFGKDVGGSVETRWRGETDSWGEVDFNYTAGFAAKTVILTAKDLDSGGVTVDYITAYKEASIDIALTPPVSRAASRRGLQYILKVEATRTELTADGRSRSVIRATLLDPNGMAVANDPVSFSLSSENGTLRTIKGTTDSAGVATAEYIAGKKIGIVVITATATLRNATGSVSIILLSDAPAKIYLKARPQSLPADGFSRSDLSVKVTDINDNPNKDTKVEFKLSKGGGKLDYADRMTDQFGDAANRYTSGTTPGVATIAATVRSKVPTDAELAKARNVLFAPYSAEGDEIRVEKWLKKKGDTALRGEPIVEYTVGRSNARYTVNAPYDCRIEFQHVEYWDKAEVGQTLAQVSPVVIPGSTNPPPPAPSPSPRRR